MCAIAGSYRAAAPVDRMLARLRHRGPDGCGIASAGDAVHGHARLALRDPTSRSAQPLAYRDGLLSFAGELWNWRELRDILGRLGHRFRSRGDVAVVAAAMAEWGAAALHRMDGMFALAWSRGGEHVLARDRYGEIPLYVREEPRGGTTWASERKAWQDQAGVVAVPPGTIVDMVSGLWTRWYAAPHKPREPPRNLVVCSPGECVTGSTAMLQRASWSLVASTAASS